ncbi:paired box protein Pax-8-like [Oculina patagonica]
MAYAPANYTGKYIFFARIKLSFKILSPPSESFLFLFGKGECKLGVHRQQGIYRYDNGKALPEVYRERMLDLHHQGFSQRQISQNMRVSVGCVNKVVQSYEESNSSLAGPRKTPVRNKMSTDVVEYVVSEKLCKPSVYTSEIQQRLLLD